MSLAVYTSPTILSQISTPTSTRSLPVINLHTSQPLPEDMAQPNMAVTLPPNFAGEFLVPELDLVFPQEDPSADVHVQVGAFVPQPPVPQEFMQ